MIIHRLDWFYAIELHFVKYNIYRLFYVFDFFDAQPGKSLFALSLTEYMVLLIPFFPSFQVRYWSSISCRGGKFPIPAASFLGGSLYSIHWTILSYYIIFLFSIRYFMIYL